MLALAAGIDWTPLSRAQAVMAAPSCMPARRGEPSLHDDDEGGSLKPPSPPADGRPRWLRKGISTLGRRGPAAGASTKGGERIVKAAYASAIRGSVGCC